MTASKLPEFVFGETRVYPGARLDLVRLLPGNLGRVLDVGCGPGGLGQALITAGKATEVCGIDISPEAVAAARGTLAEACVVDLDRENAPFAAGSFDTVIYADVLEHLKFPWKVVRDQNALLRPGGRAFCSMPNVGHYRVLGHLLRQRWDYESEGIFDYTHLHFFTRSSLEAMFRSGGYSRVACRPLHEPSPWVAAWLALPLDPLREIAVRSWWVEATSEA